jgi:putative DNA primase/helicase
MSEAILRQDWLPQVELAFEKLKAADTAVREEWCEVLREDHGPEAEAELKAKLAAHDQAMQAKLKLIESGQEAVKVVGVAKPVASWRRDRKPTDAIKVERDILDVASKSLPEPKLEIEIADEETIKRLKEAGRDVLDVATRPLNANPEPKLSTILDKLKTKKPEGFFKNSVVQLEVEDAKTAPEAEGAAQEETYVEDDVNPANDIRRKIWRIKEALKWIDPDDGMQEKVGIVLWRLSVFDREAGCTVWVEWLKAHSVDDATARAQWAKGFDGWCKAEDLYLVAQRNGWRYPVAQNLNRLDDIVERVERALIRVGVDLYQSGGKLVRPVSVMVKGRKTRIARLVEVEGSFLKAELTRYVDFFTWKKEVSSPVGPSPDVVSALLSRYGKWSFSTITGIICAPTLRRDGTVLAREGFDAATGLLVRGPLPEMPTVAAKPSRNEAERAIGTLDKLFDEFPFVDDASRSVALSGVITPVVRAALTCVPMHASTAPNWGAGKSYLLDVIAGVAIGDAMPVIAAGGDLTELAKRLDAQVIAGFTLLSIDNVSIPLGGDELCQVIERSAYAPRILGKSVMKERRNNWSLFATGNNLRINDDVTRRSLRSGLDPKMERPELRQFKNNPLEKVLQNRGLYLWAALTVVLAYRAAGMPGRLPSIGDPFSEWSDNVRSALVWLGYDDPVLTMEAIRDNDPSRQARMAMFQAIANAYGVGCPRLASQMVTDAKTGTIKQPGKHLLDQRPNKEADNLRAAITQYTNNRLDAQYLGNKLNVDKGKIAGGLRLYADKDTHTKINSWYVENL